MVDKAFWWQCPCSLICLGSVVNCSLQIRPASTSRMKNSSNSRQFFERCMASSFSSFPHRSGYSSRKERIPEGSIPNNGISSLTLSLKIITFSIAHFLALRTKPFDRYVLPLSWFPIPNTQYPSSFRSFTAATPTCASLKSVNSSTKRKTLRWLRLSGNTCL